MLKSKNIYNNTTPDSTQVVLMEFKKVTISLPKTLYNKGLILINKGLFSNFSDLVRSGIRTEFKEIGPLMEDFDDKMIYNDKELIAGVKQSRKEVRNGQGKIIKTKKAMDKYLEDL